MEISFNLLDEPWIPCIASNGSGRPKLLSLRSTLLKAHEIREIYHNSPLVVAALHRLLLAILHRLFGPEDRWIWADLWLDGKGQWDAQVLDDYFTKYHAYFDLFDIQHPFYQVSEFSHGGQPKEQPISQLSPELSSGNNLMLFDHHSDHTDESISPAAAACYLIALQAFNIGFGVSHKQDSKTISFRDAPCTRGALFLTQGDNLFQTLMLSMRQYPDPNSRLPDDPETDKPAWEMVNPFDPDRDAPFGYLDYLTWQSLQVRLLPEIDASGKLHIWGLQRIQGLGLAKGETLDPLKSYRQDKKGKPIVRGFSEKRALWRDSVALLEITGSSNPINVPENYPLLASLVFPGRILKREQRFRYLALGLATEKGKAANVALWRYERMPLPLEYLVNENAVARLRSALELSQTVNLRLNDVRDWLAWLLLKPTEGKMMFEWQKSAEYKKRLKNSNYIALQNRLPVSEHYWWRLEAPFKIVMVGLAGEKYENSLKTWRKTLRKTARTAFHEVTAKLAPSPQHLRAIAKSESELERSLNFALKIN